MSGPARYDASGRILDPWAMLRETEAHRDSLASDLQATRAELDETRHDLAKFQRSERVLAEMLREKVAELERVRRNHLRRMQREALDWADRMIWDIPDEWALRNRPRLLSLASRIRAALAQAQAGKEGAC